MCFRRYDDADDGAGDDYAGDEPEIELPRGDVTEGVVRVGSTVRRPHQPGSPAVVAYLDHFERVGFAGAPRFLGRDRRGRDVLTFLDGAIAGDPVEPWATADDPLAGVGALLRRLHDASEPWAVLAGLAFGRDLRGGSPLQLPAGPRLVSHNDVTPQNVVVRGGVAVGLIDFDLASWTTRLVELANTGMHWAPLSDPVDRDPAYDGADIPRRLRLLVDSYGLDRGGRAGLLDAFAVGCPGFTTGCTGTPKTSAVAGRECGAQAWARRSLAGSRGSPASVRRWRQRCAVQPASQASATASR